MFLIRVAYHLQQFNVGVTVAGCAVATRQTDFTKQCYMQGNGPHHTYKYVCKGAVINTIHVSEDIFNMNQFLCFSIIMKQLTRR